MGLPRELPGARYNASVGTADIMSSEDEGAEFLIAGVARFYHSTFATLLHGMVAALAPMRREVSADLLNFTLLGTLATVI